jgi:hypothetical protein
MAAAMSKPPGPREQALREMREAKYAELEKATNEARARTRSAEKAAKVGQALVDRINEASERMRNKPAKKKKK